LDKFGFAVFDSEDAMFRIMPPTTTTPIEGFDDCGGSQNSENGSAVESTMNEEEEEEEEMRKEEEEYFFSAEWLKRARPSEFSGATPDQILYGGCIPFDAFARRLHSGILAYQQSSSSFDEVASTSGVTSISKLKSIADDTPRTGLPRRRRHGREDYIGAIAVSGPITRSVSSGNNVYSLHQDPCFFTTILIRQQKNADDAAAVAAAITNDGDDDKLGPPPSSKNINDTNDDNYSDTMRSLPEQVMHCYHDSKTNANNNNNKNDNVRIRQVNFWLPHQSNGDKHLVFLSREASCAIASFQNDEHEQKHEMVVQNSNGNQWLTERGLEYIKTHMPEHVFVTNRPMIFVSANADDLEDALFHCGAVISDSHEGDDDDDSGGGGNSCSTELRVAIFSEKK